MSSVALQQSSLGSCGSLGLRGCTQEANVVFAAIDSALKQREERLQAADREQQQAQAASGASHSNGGGNGAQQLKRAMSKPPLAGPLGNPIGAGREQPPAPTARQEPAEQAAAAAKQANGGCFLCWHLTAGRLSLAACMGIVEAAMTR